MVMHSWQHHQRSHQLSCCYEWPVSCCNTNTYSTPCTTGDSSARGMYLAEVAGDHVAHCLETGKPLPWFLASDSAHSATMLPVQLLLNLLELLVPASSGCRHGSNSVDSLQVGTFQLNLHLQKADQARIGTESMQDADLISSGLNTQWALQLQLARLCVMSLPTCPGVYELASHNRPSSQHVDKQRMCMSRLNIELRLTVTCTECCSCHANSRPL